MSRGRIAMVTTFYPPYNFGGDGIGIQRLARAFVRRGWDVTVIHEADAYLALAGQRPPAVESDDGVKIISLESRHAVLSNLLTHQLGRPTLHAGALKRILAPGAFDIIWYNNISLVGGPGVLAYGDGIKIYEAHEHWLVCPTHVLWRYNREVCDEKHCLSCTLSYKRPPQLWRYTGYLERELRHVDAFVAKSAFSRDKHAQFGFPREMTVIPYFLPDLDAPDVDALAGEREAPPQERPYFLFVGRLEKIKGVQDILPAFAGEGPEDLLIVGGGDYEADLKALAAGHPRVKFVGRQPPEALNRFYRHAEALIVPSVCYETFGIILIEAFRLGVPVIARAIGPFPEIVQKSGGGLLYGDREGLVAAMSEVRASPGRRRALGDSARRAFLSFWSEEAVMTVYETLLHGLALARDRKTLLSSLEGSQT